MSDYEIIKALTMRMKMIACIMTPAKLGHPLLFVSCKRIKDIVAALVISKRYGVANKKKSNPETRAMVHLSADECS